ncbi:hypothetical protein LM701481_90066 [Listeria monocytogenes]|nr:hypothetical protein LM701481_90066 [Listeria monocytogenes]
MNEINHTSERVNTEKRTEKQIIMQKILNWFVFSLLLASIGAAIGSKLSPELYLPLVVLEVALLITAMVVRRSKTINKVVGLPSSTSICVCHRLNTWTNFDILFWCRARCRRSNGICYSNRYFHNASFYWCKNEERLIFLKQCFIRCDYYSRYI